MEDENPYASPTEQLQSTDSNLRQKGRPVRTSDGTVLPRHLAAIVDNFLAIVAAIVAVKATNEEWPILQGVVLVLVYFGYYLVFELAFSRTPGKILTGLIVVPVDGGRCNWRQTLIRTGMRFLEVNPMLFRAAPAAVCIIFSRNHQRIGDRVACTLVVPTWRVARSKKG